MDSTALALTLSGFGVLLIAISYQRHRDRRDHSALLHGISGAILFIGGALLLAVSLNLNTYAAIRSGEPLAELSIEKSAAGSYQVRLLRIPAGDLQVITLQGESWDMQARLLKWDGWANSLGLRSNIRLEQLNSLSTHGKNKAVSGYASSYSLSRDPGIRLWAWQARHPQLLKVLSTTTLTTDSMPLQDGLRFHLYLLNDQLIARQINTPARKSASNSTQTVMPYSDFSSELKRQEQTSSGSATEDSGVSEPSAAGADTGSSSATGSVLN